MDLRHQQLNQWLTDHCKLSSFQMHPLAGDASFRRYFRVKFQDKFYIAMDAPPDRENCIPFVAIANALRQVGLRTPEIMASHLDSGFLLLEDFGDQLLLRELNSENAETLYEQALDALLVLQTCRQVHAWTLATFTAELMRKELDLFKEWFLQKHLKLNWSQATDKQLARCFDFLAETAAEQPQVFMHRDYHSANLMVLSNKQMGILDFQDAFIGPVTYDLVSLLRDCYIDWPDDLVNQLVRYYFKKLNLKNVNVEEFKRWFDLMGVQRHLKALLTFSRKLHRDNNANYLQHIPRTVNYIHKITARYSDCEFLHDFIKKEVLPCGA